MTLETLTRALESDGGKLLVVVSMLVFLIVVLIVMVLTNHPPQETGRQALVGAFSSLLAILYQYLKSSKQ